MAEEKVEPAPVVERRRVIIEYTIPAPGAGVLPPTGPWPDPALVEAIRVALIKTGFRNLDIFGGKA